MIPVTVYCAPRLSASGAADRYDQPDMEAIVPRINMKSATADERRLRLAREKADAKADADTLNKLLHPKAAVPKPKQEDAEDGADTEAGDEGADGADGAAAEDGEFADE